MARKVIVVKDALYAKSLSPGLVQHARNYSRAFNSKLLTAHIWRWEENFDSHLRSYRRISAAQDQSAIQRYIARESSFRMFSSVVPMEDYRQLQSVPDCSSALNDALENWTEPHNEVDTKVPSLRPQAAERLKIA